MITETNKQDVNTGTSSGAEQNAQSTESTQAGQTPKQDKPEPTILEMAQKVHADYAKKEATPKEVQDTVKDESQSEDGKIQKLNPTEKKEQTTEKDEKVDNGEESKTGDKQESDELPKDKGPVPYERFSEVYTKSKQLEQEVESSKPLVEGQRQIIEYCRQHQITQEQFSQGLELVALMNTNPTAAVQTMAKWAGELQDMTGDRLPEDLATEVANGDITENRAKELAKLRAQTKQGERTQQQMQQVRQQEQEQRLVSEVGNASNMWVKAKQGIDPDYRPKAGPNAPDGKFELVRAKYFELVNQTNEKGQPVQVIKSAQDCQKFLDLAYDAVEKTLAMYKPKATNKSKNLSANNSNGGEQKAPTTIQELARQVGAKHGITI